MITSHGGEQKHSSGHTWRDSCSDSEIRVAADPSPIFTQAYETAVCVCVCIQYSRGFPF